MPAYWTGKCDKSVYRSELVPAKIDYFFYKQNYKSKISSTRCPDRILLVWSYSTSFDYLYIAFELKRR